MLTSLLGRRFTFLVQLVESSSAPKPVWTRPTSLSTRPCVSKAPTITRFSLSTKSGRPVIIRQNLQGFYKLTLSVCPLKIRRVEVKRTKIKLIIKISFWLMLSNLEIKNTKTTTINAENTHSSISEQYNTQPLDKKIKE